MSHLDVPTPMSAASESNRESSPSAETPRTGCGFVSGILLPALLIFYAGYFLINLPQEIGRWHRAAAYDRYLDGDLEGALAGLEPAFAWSDAWELHYQRGQWRLAAGDAAGALADFDKVQQSLPEEQAALRLQLDSLIASAHRRAGQCDEMAAALDRSVAWVEERAAADPTNPGFSALLAHVLNNRAYLNALCEQRLDESLADINRALRLVPDTGAATLRSSVSAALDTRGYLLYLQGRYELAYADYNRAIAIAEEQHREQSMELERTAQLRVDRRSLDQELERGRQQLAVMYQHRGQVYEKLGRLFDAQQDFDRARRLGFDPAAGVE